MSRHITAVIDMTKDDNEVCYLMLSEVKKEIRYCRNAKRLEALTEKASILMRGMLANELILSAAYGYLDQTKRDKSNKFKKNNKKSFNRKPA